MQGKDNRNAPNISIDDALNLFLAVTYPNGIPEGVDKEQLMEALRQKIAKDRPEWAKNDEERTRASRDAGSASGQQNYSRVKDEVVRKAQQEEIPEDPEERYLYERRKEAIQNREQKKAEERENQIREDLRKRLTAQKKEEDRETLEKALLIREALEKRLRQTLKVPQTETPSKEGKKPLNINMQPPNMVGLTPLKNAPTPPAGTTDSLTPAPPSWEPRTRKENAREFFNSIKDLDPDEKVRSFQEFNRARRNNLKSREDLLSSRRPSRSRSDELMAMTMDRTETKDKDESLANNMAFSSGSKSRRLTLE